MASFFLEVKDSKFVAHNNLNVEEFSSNRVVACGWECLIDQDGNISCTSSQTVLGEIHKIKFTIKAGWVDCVVRVSNDRRPVRVLKSGKLNKWPVDGTIELTDGPISKRKAFFSKYSFTKFLDDYGITEVQAKNPNKIFQIIEKSNGIESIFREELECNGNTEVISNETVKDKKKIPYQVQLIKVTGANWVVKTIWEYGEVKKRILYTYVSPHDIEGLPKIK